MTLHRVLGAIALLLALLSMTVGADGPLLGVAVLLLALTHLV